MKSIKKRNIDTGIEFLVPWMTQHEREKKACFRQAFFSIPHSLSKFLELHMADAIG
jgi:hypothetical protein